MSDALNPKSPNALASQWAVVFLSRIVINTARRFVYPFAPAIGRGLDVPLSAVAAIIAANQLTGLLSIGFGPLGDRFGYRRMMLAGLFILTAGLFMAGVVPTFGCVVAGLVLAGTAKGMFDPSALAYMSAYVPFNRRGLAVGMLEMSWAAGSLIGIPLVGLTMERFGWRASFFLLGALGLICTGMLIRVVPSNGIRDRAPARALNLAGARRGLLKNRKALGALLFALCTSGANDVVFVIYGAWFETVFGLGLAALGASTIVIGLAELLGEGVVAAAADRLGLKRSLFIGLFLSILAYLSLPKIAVSLPLALAGLFFVFFSAEFTVVAAISFCTEILPDSRATMISAFLAFAGVGRVTGALMGGALWSASGIRAVSVAAAGAAALGFCFLVWGFGGRERET